MRRRPAESPATGPANRPGSALDFDRESSRLGAGERFARRGVRSRLQGPAGSGVVDTVTLADGALLNVVNLTLARTEHWDYENDGALVMLRASLACDVTFRTPGAPALVFDRPELTLVCHPARVPLSVEIAGGRRQQSIVLTCRASRFARCFGLEAADLPPLLGDAIAGRATPGRIVSVPLTHRLATLVSDLLDTPLDGELRVLQYRGRVQELVACALEAMRRAPALSSGSTTALHRRRDLEIAHAALARLDASYRRPPRFPDLAREIGTNQNKLKVVFREAFGLTMAEYCLQRRIREAQRLLLEGSLTIAQVAERVGYEHQSSFAAAFAAHVGRPPREYRRHRPPFSVEFGRTPDKLFG